MNSNFYPIKIWPRIAYFNGQSGKTKYFLNTNFNLKLKFTAAKLQHQVEVAKIKRRMLSRRYSVR